MGMNAQQIATSNWPRKHQTETGNKLFAISHQSANNTKDCKKLILANDFKLNLQLSAGCSFNQNHHLKFIYFR